MWVIVTLNGCVVSLIVYMANRLEANQTKGREKTQ